MKTLMGPEREPDSTSVLGNLAVVDPVETGLAMDLRTDDRLDPIDGFQAHLEVCKQCRDLSYCPVGDPLLVRAAKWAAAMFRRQNANRGNDSPALD